MSSQSARSRPQIEPDHLVVAARTLEEGVAWCEATLGVVPAPGGQHPTMATHNRLLALSSSRFARMYLEIIAIDPDAPSPSRVRWFDLDAPALQEAIAVTPRLVHWVARTKDIDAGLIALRAAGYELGTAIAAERMTPRGPLRWRIALRDDGRRSAAGAVPLLIEWGDVHPCDALPASGVRVERIEISGIADPVAASLGARAAAAGSPPLAVSLATPRGRVDLVSPAP